MNFFQTERTAWTKAGLFIRAGCIKHLFHPFSHSMPIHVSHLWGINFLKEQLVKGEIVTKEAWRIRGGTQKLIKVFYWHSPEIWLKNFRDTQIHTFHYSKYCSQLLNGYNNAYLPVLQQKWNETIKALLRWKHCEIGSSTRASPAVIKISSLQKSQFTIGHRLLGLLLKIVSTTSTFKHLRSACSYYEQSWAC